MKNQIFFSIIIPILALISKTKEAGTGYKCWDQTTSTDCACSGPIGKCSCSTSPNVRQGWLCTITSNGDSVRKKML